MSNRAITRNPVPMAAAAIGLLLVFFYGVDRFLNGAYDLSRGHRLLTQDSWHCEVHDPEGRSMVAHSVETFHASGTLDGRTRLEDRQAGRVLLEFSYRGVWQFEDPWLTEAISEYRYLHVDDAAFSREELAAIEAEFGEPEISRVHALTESQLVYGAHQSLYQCHRNRHDEGSRA